MRIQVVFYIIGVIFIFFSVWYFAGTYLKNIPDLVKLIILFVGVVLFFVIGELLREADK